MAVIQEVIVVSAVFQLAISDISLSFAAVARTSVIFCRREPSESGEMASFAVSALRAVMSFLAHLRFTEVARDASWHLLSRAVVLPNTIFEERL